MKKEKCNTTSSFDISFNYYTYCYSYCVLAGVLTAKQDNVLNSAKEAMFK